MNLARNKCLRLMLALAAARHTTSTCRRAANRQRGTTRTADHAVAATVVEGAATATQGAERGARGATTTAGRSSANGQRGGAISGISPDLSLWGYGGSTTPIVS